MNDALKIFRRFAIPGLVLYILYGSFLLLDAANQFANSPGAGDFVTGWEERMKRVKNKLPDNVTEIGYVADWDLPGVEVDPVDQDNEYMLSQYTLTPIHVVPGLESEWILGNFTTPGFQDWLDQSLHEYEIDNLGYGIYLIRRTTP